MSVPDHEVFCDSRLAMFVALLFELNWFKGLIVWRLSSRSFPGEHVIPCNYHLSHVFPRFWLVTRFPRLSLVICFPAPANRFPCNSLIPCFAALVIVYMISHPRRRELAFRNYLWLQVCSSFRLNQCSYFLFCWGLGHFRCVMIGCSLRLMRILILRIPWLASRPSRSSPSWFIPRTLTSLFSWRPVWIQTLKRQ